MHGISSFTLATIFFQNAKGKWVIVLDKSSFKAIWWYFAHVNHNDDSVWFGLDINKIKLYRYIKLIHQKFSNSDLYHAIKYNYSCLLVFSKEHK